MPSSGTSRLSERPPSSLPDSVRAQAPEVPWKRIAGLRDILIHDYFGIDFEIIWDVVTDKLAVLGDAASRLLAV